VSGTGLRVHRAAHHSFWHDNVSEAATRGKLRRRIDRFLALRDEGRDLLFTRSCASTNEVQEIPAMYEVLSDRLGKSRERRLLLAVQLEANLLRSLSLVRVAFSLWHG